jgi:hypothetical protein
LDADERPSNNNRLKSCKKIRYSRRTDTAHDHAQTTKHPVTQVRTPRQTFGTPQARESAGQGGQERSVRPGQARPGHLAAQHRDFVAQDQNLDVLGGGAAGKQPEPAEHGDRDQLQQSEQHGSRSCHAHVE